MVSAARLDNGRDTLPVSSRAVSLINDQDVEDRYTIPSAYSGVVYYVLILHYIITKKLLYISLVSFVDDACEKLITNKIYVQTMYVKCLTRSFIDIQHKQPYVEYCDGRLMRQRCGT